MFPSSRTPEGDRIQCHLCGALNAIEPSRPPGDVTCPACGTLIWVPDPEIERGKQAIRTFVAGIQELVSSAAPRKELGDFLVHGLTGCLAAHGATLWVCSRRRWWKRRINVAAESFIAQTDSCKQFAERVANDPDRQPILAEDPGDAVLRIGVPIVTNRSTTGVIQVLQRPNTSDGHRRGYIRFIDQLAQIVATSAAFSA